MNKIEILETDYKELKITDKTVENIKKYPRLHLNIPVREAMGKIYTNEAFETKKVKIKSLLNRKK